MSEKAVMPEEATRCARIANSMVEVEYGQWIKLADYNALRAYATALRDENERLSKDAERYQWLRSDNEQHCDEELPHVCINAVTDRGKHYSKFLTPSELDAAIDAAKGDGNER